MIPVNFDLDNLIDEEFRPIIKEFLKDNLHNKIIKDFQSFTRKLHSAICDYLFENAEELDLPENYMEILQNNYINIDSFIGLIAIGSPYSEVDFGGCIESPEMELVEDELDKVYDTLMKKIKIVLIKVFYF